MTTLIRRRGVIQKTGMTVSQLYAAMSEGRFPKPVKIGRKSVAWIESELETWCEQRIAERDAQNPKLSFKRGGDDAHAPAARL